MVEIQMLLIGEMEELVGCEGKEFIAMKDGR